MNLSPGAVYGRALRVANGRDTGTTVTTSQLFSTRGNLFNDRARNSILCKPSLTSFLSSPVRIS